ncbi:hypothetical protein GN278_07475 [Rhodobacteraceae bacterium Araon29]
MVLIEKSSAQSQLINTHHPMATTRFFTLIGHLFQMMLYPKAEQQFNGAVMGQTASKAKVNAETAHQNGLSKARESFAGRLLTDAQFNEAIHITEILEREIYKSGSFKDKLGNYAYAMGRSENMDPKRLETTLRDLYRERTGQTMFQLCESLKEREAAVQSKAQDIALNAAHEIEPMMANGDKINFNRALAEKAQMLADDYGVRDNHAKKLMADAFVAEQRAIGVETPLELRDWGKQLDEHYYRPQIEQEKQARAAAKQNQDTSARSFSRRS